MTLRECRVDRPFPHHMTRCWVRTEPPRSMGNGRLFKLTFWHLSLSTPKRCCMDLGLAQLVLTHHHRHRLHLLPSATSPGVRVISSFFLSLVLSSGGLPFALFSVKLRAVFLLSFLSKYFVRVALFIQPTGPPSGCLDCCLIGVAVGKSL
jgi:hypothetical protein